MAIPPHGFKTDSFQRCNELYFPKAMPMRDYYI